MPPGGGRLLLFAINPSPRPLSTLSVFEWSPTMPVDMAFPASAEEAVDPFSSSVDPSQSSRRTLSVVEFLLSSLFESPLAGEPNSASPRDRFAEADPPATERERSLHCYSHRSHQCWSRRGSSRPCSSPKTLGWVQPGRWHNFRKST